MGRPGRHRHPRQSRHHRGGQQRGGVAPHQALPGGALCRGSEGRARLQHRAECEPFPFLVTRFLPQFAPWHLLPAGWFTRSGNRSLALPEA
eukprot:3620470-Pyramimonas_sp.AAC.1